MMHACWQRDMPACCTKIRGRKWHVPWTPQVAVAAELVLKRGGGWEHGQKASEFGKQLILSSARNQAKRNFGF